MKDVAFALRLMRRTPVLTAAVLLTVSFAIAANTTIFSVVNAVMLRPMPFKEPGRLLQVAEKNDKLNLPSFGASVLNFIAWREQTKTFQELAAITGNSYTLTGIGEAEQFSGNRVSPAMTRVLGLTPIKGRDFRDDEEGPNAAAVAMIGEGLWKRRFGADKSVIGKSVILNGVPTTIVGVAPAALNLISGGEIYTPLTIDPAKEVRLSHLIFVIGRLKPGISINQAQADMGAVSAHLDQQYPEMRDWGIRVITLFDTFVSPELKTGLLVLMGAVTFVLLIACANIANLLLARAAARENEMAVRTALGASRLRLVRQLLIESVVLSVSGGVAGLVGANIAVGVLNKLLPPNTLPIPTVGIDATVLTFAAAITIITGLLFGIAPALRTTKIDINDVLKHGGRGSAGGFRNRLLNGLIAAEVAMATVLLIGAGLFIQTLVNLQHVRLGFDPRGLITFQLAPPTEKYPLASKAGFLYRDLIESLQTIPGVRSAAVSSGIPFGAGNYTTHPMTTTEASALPPDTAVPVDWRSVSPTYFKTMGIPLLRGREFTDADGSTTPVMIISQETAKKFWGSADPLGHALRRTANPNIAYTIVGVVGDVRSTALNQESPALYYPIPVRMWPLMDVVVRTESSPDLVLPAIRQRVHQLDTELALANVRRMDEWLSNSAAQPRLNTIMLSVFASMALLIAAIGIYAVLAYSVSQRNREIGLRIAVGATPSAILKLIVGDGLKVAMTGLGIGVAGSLIVSKVVSSIVYGITPRDPGIFAAGVFILAGVALAACLIPAHRGSRIDPMEALRYE